MIPIFSGIVYLISLIMILKEKRFYDRAVAVVYFCFVCLIINDLNTKRYLVEGYNYYAHAIFLGYSFYAMYKHVKLQRLIKEHLQSPTPTLITWENLLHMEKHNKDRLNNNVIKTGLKYEEKHRRVYISTVYSDTLADNYVNDFSKKIRVLEGQCHFKLIKGGEIYEYDLKEGDTIETMPMQEHWFITKGVTVIMEVTCVK